ncbi:TRAP transporter small permease [Insolitispirillum peregrinum]|uniref:TRAP transporter small permease n=1 Tax=Insolitispirillum peregrinum TaxID=80876 RepID=UPI00360AB806
MGVINRMATAIAGSALAALVLMTIAAVIARYVFDAPFHWTEEVSGLLMIWIVMVGAIVTERDDQHLTIPVLVEILPPRIQAAVSLVITGLSVAILGYGAWLGWLLAKAAESKLTGVLQFSWFWIDLAYPVGSVGIVVFLLAKMLRDLRTLLRGDH